PYKPYSFSGDVDMQCTLLGGPVRDFNLMLRRGRVNGKIAVVRFDPARIPPARFRFCYAVTGSCECLIGGHVLIPVPTDHALRVEEDGVSATELAVTPSTADAVALAVSITPLGEISLTAVLT